MISKLLNIAMGKEVSSEEELLFRFKEYYLTERDFVRNAIYWMVRSDVVDDLVQETFVKAWKNFRKFEENSRFRTWIYRIAMNVTYDYLKKNSSNELKELTEVEIKGEDIALKDLIDKGLLQLTIEQREVFILFYKMNYKQSEIAELLKIPAGTVKSRLFHAREVFEKYLKENGVDHE